MDGQPLYEISPGLSESSETMEHYDMVEDPSDEIVQIEGYVMMPGYDPSAASQPQEEETEPVYFEPHPNYESYDATIEDVIRESAQTVTDEEMAEFEKQKQCARARRASRPKLSRERDSLALPFQYSGQSFTAQSQKLILNVMHFLKHKKDASVEAVKTPQEKAARLLNISSSVIGKIRKNWKVGKLEQPGRIRQMAKRVLDTVTSEDELVIRDIVRELYERRVSPSIPHILLEARRRINYEGSRTSFRRILHRMGYKYRKVDKKLVMIDPTGSTVPQHVKPRTVPQHVQPRDLPPNPHQYGRRIKKESKKMTRAPQIVEVYSTTGTYPDLEDHEPIYQPKQEEPFSEEGIIEAGSSQIQVFHGLSDSDDGILLEADTQNFHQGEIVLQVEGQHYRFQLIPAPDQDQEPR